MIVITGANRGLGKSIAERLLSKKKEVFGISKNFEKKSFDGMKCDISSYDDIKAIQKKFKERKTKISALINAAGIASMNLAIITPKRKTEEIIKTNLLGTIYCSQLISALMIRNKKGCIINFSTIAVALGLKGESIYAASKAGVEGFSRSFAREMSDFNIRVNCIAPGPIKTDLLRGVNQNQINKIVSQQIIQKQFSPDEVCDVVELLLDQKSESISGQVIKIGGS